MLDRRVYTPSEIRTFSESTGDDIILHNPEIMKQRNRYPIVQGLFLLVDLLKLQRRFLIENAALIEMYINGCANPYDELVMGNEKERDGSYRMAVFKGVNDIISLKETHSRMLQIDGKETLPSGNGGRQIRLCLDAEKLKKFKELVEINEDSLASLLYAMASSSRALLNCVKEPTSDLEKHVLDLMNSPEQHMPVYTYLSFIIPGNGKFVDKDNELGFNIDITQNDERYDLCLTCKQNERILYTAHHKAVPIKLDVIMRHTKKITY